MHVFLLRRLLFVLPVIGGVLSFVFLIIHLLPGDPVDAMLGETASAVDRQALRRQLGLDRPLWHQYLTFVHHTLRGDLGRSLHSRRPVATLIAERLPATAVLAVASLVVAVGLALPLGVLAALRPRSLFDSLAMLLALVGVSMPNFWLGPLLILIFALHFGWLPVSGRGDGSLPYLILPAITLGTAMLAVLTRMTRASLLDVLQADYIRTACAKGLPGWVVVWKHALGNALIPLLTLIGLQSGALLSGAVITETVFAWPGLGELTIRAIQQRDYPVVQGCVLIIALTYVVINLLTDVLYAHLDPRIRFDT
ncbi:Dipeptide transport system permease protein DppB [Candidatus Entotheonellaceae bacterium PAL068K]